MNKLSNKGVGTHKKNIIGFKLVTTQYKHTSHMTIERKGTKSSKIEAVAKFRVLLDPKVANNGCDITYFQMRCKISPHN